MDIELIPMLKDNYAYLLQSGGQTAIVDPAEAGPIEVLLGERGLTLDYILNTHHHHDHTGGNAALKKEYGCKIIGAAADTHRIAGLDNGLRDGDRFMLGSSEAIILETPGHTTGAICFYFPAAKSLFCGDTLFAMGCGRLFEGTPEQMWNSLLKIMALPDDTKIYCGHEYTQSGGTFCLTVEPDNEALQERMKAIAQLRAKNLPTIPTTLALEKKTNVFLRAGSATAFAKRRTLKDDF